MSKPKAKRIKATHAQDQAWWLGDHYILPADAESYERMVEQVKRSVWPHKNLADDVHEAFRKVARDVLKSIGITAPKRGKKGSK